VSDGADDVLDAGVVRAGRFELVDGGGRVRGVFGRLDSPDVTADLYGLALLNGEGKARVWLVLDATGPSQVFDLEGNNVIVLGVNDATADALHVGAYLHMSDADGTPVVGWQVQEDGSVVQRIGGATR
jgi:hypothetical protein